MKQINNMVGGRDVNQDDDYDDPFTESFTKSKVDDDDQRFFQSKHDYDYDDDLLNYFPRKETPSRPEVSIPSSTPPRKKDNIKTEKTPDISKPVQTYPTPRSDNIPQTKSQKDVPPTKPNNERSSPQIKVVPPKTPPNKDTKSNVKTPQEISQKNTPLSTPKPKDPEYPKTPAVNPQSKLPDPPRRSEPVKQESARKPDVKPSPLSTPKQAEPVKIPEKPIKKPEPIKETPQKPQVDPKGTPKNPNPPAVAPSKPETKPVAPSKPETKPVAPSKPETKPVAPSKPETKQNVPPPQPPAQPPQGQNNKLPVNETKPVPQSEIKDDVSTLGRPAFLRRGKATQFVANVQKAVESYKGDDRIKAIEARNPKETLKEYVVKQFPDSKDKFLDTQHPNNLSIVYQQPKKQRDQPVRFERAEGVNQQRQLDALALVDPNDITPGTFETWHILTALAALCERPETIVRMLEDQKYNQQGFYYVRLCVDGVWRYVIVDDNFPIINNTNMAAGSALDARVNKLNKANPGYKNELWVSLIEKAISKVYGCYEDLEKNKASVKDDLYLLTGAPCYELELSLENINDITQFLKEMHEDTIVSISLRNSTENVQFFRDNLNISHCYGYTLLGYDDKSKQVRLRNPWGWLKPNVKSTGVVKILNDEGEFAVSVQDLVKYFDLATVCNFKKNYWTTSIAVRQLPNCYSAYELTTKNETNCFLTFIQLDRRYFRNNLKEKYDFSFARILVFNSDNQLIMSNAGQAKTVSVELNLAAGKYIVVLVIDWNNTSQINEPPYDSTLQYYGSEECTLKRVNFKDKPNQLANSMGPHAVQNGQKKPTQQQQVSEHLLALEDESLVVLAWKNNSDQAIKFKRDLTKITNRNKLRPLCFAQQADMNENLKLSTNKMQEKLVQGWQTAPNVEIDLPPNQVRCYVLKPVQSGVKCDKTFLKQLQL